MNRPDTSVTFRALAEAAVGFAAGQVLGFGLVSACIHEAGMGVGGAFLLMSPFFALCIVPACLARLYHEAWRSPLTAGAYITVWLVAGFIFSCGWGIAFIRVRAPVLVEALAPASLAPLISLAYAALAPFILPVALSAAVPRRFRLRSASVSAF